MSSSNSNNQHPSSSSADLASQSNPNVHLDPNNGYAPSDNQLAGLVEAATAAAGQDVSPQWAAAVATAAGVAGHHQLDGYGADMHLGDDGFGDANFGAGMGGGRHLRVPNDHSQGSGLSRTVSKKRKRNDDNLDPALAGAGLSGAQQQNSQQSQQAQQAQHGYAGDNIDIRPVPPQSLSEARAVGVHSAAALFRQPSSNKKYTRPPMSKLFASLELSPENFLHLQAAAKGFMLDDDHPERRDCVGQRGKGDTEMVKLRLWNCVSHFLEAEGNGERFFGEDVVNEGMGPRTYIWPHDKQKIISLVIPLLRRMVTNERQRQYAIETRKGGGTEERRRRKTNESFQDLDGPRFSPEQQLQQMHNQSQSMPPPPPPGQAAQAAIESDQIMDIGLADLLLDGYTVDWNEIARSYDMYNHDYELDNLWSLSGLQQPDWRGLVAAVDSHYHVVHNGDYECPPGCEKANVDRIIHADATANLSWRIGGGRNLPARDEFASSITRDVSRIIRENIAARHGAPPTSHVPAGADHQFHPQQPFVPIQDSKPHLAANVATSNTNSHTQIYLRINVLQHGKRILPRLDVPAGHCPNVHTIKESVLRRYHGQIPGLPLLQGSDNIDQQIQDSTAAASWKVKALLPDGLVDVQSEKDWAFALLSADTVDWMDGDLKILVELEGGNTQ
ncbi:uncharacterized protein N7482_008710 [Penicillium canariense]|uniref:Uncharacterized protein n=1 Tax=Penicillium canariense TaxID=189055 RepID=A0A9W9HWH2_9EURO|nr:uncharacterized protein N7482_008710 [Penicillium canariense]KAJ5157610.1 hypothetical protein N7482_008710 [Penicillium canariense]